MRVIEKQMNEAIRLKKNFKSGNTQVVINNDEEYDGEFAEVFLFDNPIGHFNYTYKQFIINFATLRKYPTVTTVSRLHALGAPVRLVKGVPYYRDIKA